MTTHHPETGEPTPDLADTSVRPEDGEQPSQDPGFEEVEVDDPDQAGGQD